MKMKKENEIKKRKRRIGEKRAKRGGKKEESEAEKAEKRSKTNSRIISKLAMTWITVQFSKKNKNKKKQKANNKKKTKKNTTKKISILSLFLDFFVKCYFGWSSGDDLVATDARALNS